MYTIFSSHNQIYVKKLKLSFQCLVVGNTSKVMPVLIFTYYCENFTNKTQYWEPYKLFPIVFCCFDLISVVNKYFQVSCCKKKLWKPIIVISFKYFVYILSLIIIDYNVYQLSVNDSMKIYCMKFKMFHCILVYISVLYHIIHG